MPNMRLMPVRKAADALGVSIRTLYRWEESGKLVPVTHLASGARRYSDKQLEEFLGGAGSDVRRQRAAVYARVSSSKQKADGNLERQTKRLHELVAANGWDLALTVEETASGVNEHRRGLQKLLRAASRGDFDVLVVEYRDRLARFGYTYLEAAFKASAVRVAVADEQSLAKEPVQELMDDLLAIVMVFAARMYGRRSSRVRQGVKAVLEQEMEEIAAHDE